MKRKIKKSHLLIFLLSVVVFCLSVVVVYRGIRGFREARVLDELLTRVDRRLEQERYDEVPPLLMEASGVVSTGRNALRVLKRAHRLWTAIDDSEPLARLSLRWHRRFPGNSDISAVTALVLLEEGDDRIGRLRPDERFFDDHPHLAAGLLQATGESPPHWEYPFSLLRLSRTSTPQELLDASEVAGRWEYAADAALQLASSGYIRDALTQAENHDLTQHEPIMVATMAYDKGRWEAAAEILGPIAAADPQSLALRADAMYLAGRTSTALTGYQGLYLSGRPYGPRSYSNAALIAANPEERLRVLQEGLTTYPGDPYLTAAILSYEGGEAADTDIVAQLRAGNGPTESLVSYLIVEAPTRPPDANASQLWHLVNQNPDHIPTVSYLAWYLAGIGREGDIDRLLATTTAPQTGALAFYRGVYQTGRGDFQGAFLSFLAANDARYAWQAAHNAAVVGLDSGRWDESLAAISAAEGEAWYRLSDAERSRLKVLRARVYLRQGKTDKARSGLHEALALAPQNSSAQRLLAALEEQ